MRNAWRAVPSAKYLIKHSRYIMAAVLISDNGPHSADAWANAAAEHIFAISPDIAAGRLIEAKRVQIGIAMALLPLFKGAMAAERDNLQENEDHSDKALSVDTAAVAYIIKEIVALAGQSPWKDQLGSLAWITQATKDVTSFLNSVQQIERFWHADKTDNKSAKAYKAKFHGDNS